ncbi:MAG: carbonic anhydrase family protein [Planctomycetota bacterium]
MIVVRSCLCVLLMVVTTSTLFGQESGNKQAHPMPGLKHGMCQSPINILTQAVAKDTPHSIVLDYKRSTERVRNLGHTIEVEYDAGNTIAFDGKVFDFRQFHFHTPSEHLVDGVTYPMEMHMVHTLKERNAENETVYLVIGALFKQGRENAFLNEFIRAIPKKVGEETVVRGGTVNVNDLFRLAPKLEFYHYNGSLTTPPYTETVTWLIIKSVFEASPQQIETFKRLEGNNARHVQALFGRKVDSE